MPGSPGHRTQVTGEVPLDLKVLLTFLVAAIIVKPDDLTRPALRLFGVCMEPGSLQALYG